MPTFTSPREMRLSGMIHRLDLMNRELEMLTNMRRTAVVVPPGCVVLLRGEPVKLRILQPGDFIEVAFFMRGSMRVAREIKVDGSRPFSPTTN